MEREDLIDFLTHKGHGVTGLSQLNLDRIPDQFIQPPEDRVNHIQVASIPIIDVSKWDDPKVSESICEAAAELGFFQIINHGIPSDVVENVKTAAHRFFGLPVEERRNYLKDNSPSPSVVLKTSFSPFTEKVLEWKDLLFHFADPKNPTLNSQFWPPVSRDPVLEYIKLATPVIKKLLKQIDEAKESALMGHLAVNLLYYPNPELVAGAGPHSSITVLLQDDVGGLYVRATQGDSLVINIGDVLQIMSNDRYKSVEHQQQE